MRRLLASLASLALALVLITFAVANRSFVAVVLPTTEIAVEIPLYFVFFAGALFGVLLAGLVTLWPRLRGLHRARKAERRAAAADQRISELETTPPAERPASLAAIDHAQEPGADGARPQLDAPARNTG